RYIFQHLIRLNPIWLDGTSQRCKPACNRNPNPPPAREGLPCLHRPLAVSGGSNQGSAAIILESSGHHFASAGAKFIYQNHHWHSRRNRVSIGLDLFFATICATLDKNNTTLDKHAHNIKRRIQIATR